MVNKTYLTILLKVKRPCTLASIWKLGCKIAIEVSDESYWHMKALTSKSRHLSQFFSQALYIEVFCMRRFWAAYNQRYRKLNCKTAKVFWKGSNVWKPRSVKEITENLMNNVLILFLTFVKGLVIHA